jgi:hypothetical protein
VTATGTRFSLLYYHAHTARLVYYLYRAGLLVNLAFTLEYVPECALSEQLALVNYIIPDALVLRALHQIAEGLNKYKSAIH